MGWFWALVRGKRLRPVWEFTVRGVIWRLLPTGKGQFVGEERDIEKKSVSFFCIRQDTGAVQWAHLRLAESWWIGIEAVHNDVVLLHEFAMPDFPDHKKIHALDLSSGRLLWANEDLKYLFARGDNVYAARDLTEESLFVELDGSTGRERRELDPQEANSLRRRVQEGIPIDFPIPFPNAGGGRDDVGAAIEKVVAGANRVRFIEYLQRNEFLAVGYYAAIGSESADPLGEQLLDQHFVIAEMGTGRILYREVLNSRASAAVPDAFFGLGDRLYSISGRNVLKAFDLAGTGSPNHD